MLRAMSTKRPVLLLKKIGTTLTFTWHGSVTKAIPVQHCMQLVSFSLSLKLRKSHDSGHILICIVHTLYLPECNLCQHVRLFPFMTFIFTKICAQEMFNTAHGYKEHDH